MSGQNITSILEQIEKIQIKTTKEAESLLQKLLSKLDINVKDSKGNSFIHAATKNGSLILVQLLIERGANINNKNKNLDTPLHIASRYGYADLVNLFLDKEMYVNITNIRNNTPLHEATAYKQADVVEILLNQNANANIENIDGNTPFMLANSEDIILIFINSRPNLLDEDFVNRILPETVKRNWEKLFELLIINPNTAFSLVAKYGRYGMLEKLIKNGANLAAPIEEFPNNTSLHIAAYNGSSECVKLLIKYIKNVDYKNSLQQTPLLLAVQKGNNQIIDILLDNNANIFQIDKLLCNVLHHACYQGHVNTIEYLLQKRCLELLEGRNIFGQTPLYLASWLGYDRIVQLLIEKGADVNAKSKLLWTPLEAANYNHHQTIVKLLLENRADRSVLNKSTKLY